MAKISVLRSGAVLASACAEGTVKLRFDGAYLPGDVILFESDSDYVFLRVDGLVPPARMYLPQRKLTYRVPVGGDGLTPYAPGAFMGERHEMSLAPDETRVYRNLSVNPADQRGDTEGYPHATANVETRDESIFAARNAIDGLTFSAGHGMWPYESWGIGTRTDAYLTVDFGRNVTVDKAVLYLRADYPHDSYWEKAELVFSDGSRETLSLKQVDGLQVFAFTPRTVTSVRIRNLVKADLPSPFPALRQIELYGTDA